MINRLKRITSIDICIILCLVDLYLPYEVFAKTKYKVTAYGYTRHCSQTDNKPNVTAFGCKPLKGKTVAVSHDLSHLKHKYVKLMSKDRHGKIKTVGSYRVNDLMNKRHRRSIDICFGRDKKAARIFGKRKNIFLVVCNPKDERRNHGS